MDIKHYDNFRVLFTRCFFSELYILLPYDSTTPLSGMGKETIPGHSKTENICPQKICTECSEQPYSIIAKT